MTIKSIIKLDFVIYFNLVVDMFKHFLSFSFWLLLISFSLFAIPPKAPDWVLDKNVVFPSETYISGLGEGKSKKLAKENAISEISRYLKTEIKTTVKAESKADSYNGKTNYSQKLEENVTISS